MILSERRLNESMTVATRTVIQNRDDVLILPERRLNESMTVATRTVQ